MTDRQMKSIDLLEENGREDRALAIINDDGFEQKEPEPVDQTVKEGAATGVEASAVVELRELPPIDRATLGSLLRAGQRLAQHIQAKVALPEFVGWARDAQKFMNENGL